MAEAVVVGGVARPVPSREAVPAESRELLDWLRTGRLTLVGVDRSPVSIEQWPTLPAEIRARALADFRRLVSSNSKAAVLFVRP